MPAQSNDGAPDQIGRGIARRAAAKTGHAGAPDEADVRKALTHGRLVVYLGDIRALPLGEAVKRESFIHIGSLLTWLRFGKHSFRIPSYCAKERKVTGCGGVYTEGRLRFALISCL